MILCLSSRSSIVLMKSCCLCLGTRGLAWRVSQPPAQLDCVCAAIVKAWEALLTYTPTKCSSGVTVRHRPLLSLFLPAKMSLLNKAASGEHCFFLQSFPSSYRGFPRQGRGEQCKWERFYLSNKKYFLLSQHGKGRTGQILKELEKQI